MKILLRVILCSIAFLFFLNNAYAFIDDEQYNTYDSAEYSVNFEQSRVDSQTYEAELIGTLLVKTAGKQYFNFEIYPQSEPDQRQYYEKRCSTHCGIEITLDSPVLFGTYVVNVYSPLGEQQYYVDVQLEGVGGNQKEEGSVRINISNKVKNALEKQKRTSQRMYEASQELFQKDRKYEQVRVEYTYYNGTSSYSDYSVEEFADINISSKVQAMTIEYDGVERRVRPRPFVEQTSMKGDPGVFVDNQTQEPFAQGLVSVNTHKPLYKSDETVQFYIVVLDSQGYPYDRANITMNIIRPDENIEVLSIHDKTLEATNNRGVYTGFMKAINTGEYGIYVEAYNGEYIVGMNESFIVTTTFPFDIVRQTPSTIDPWQGPFRNEIVINNVDDQQSVITVKDKMPTEFILHDTNAYNITYHPEYIELLWRDISIDAIPYYVAQAPREAPDLYELGPASIEYAQGIFVENRTWLLAIDPLFINDSDRTCSQTFGFPCNQWPSTSEGDNTFDTCSNSAGSDENIFEVTLNVTEALPLQDVNVQCTMDPWSNANEEYIYYHNGTGWRQIYAGAPPSGDIYTRSVNFTLDNVSGTHHVRCILDWDGENDECADVGSFYDNDDVSLEVLNPFLEVLQPDNETYPYGTIDTIISTSVASNISYQIDARPVYDACTNCFDFTKQDFYEVGAHELRVTAVSSLGTNIWTEFFTVLSDDYTPDIDTNPRTCSDVFGAACSLWPAASENDNTFDSCPTSVGTDEHVNEVVINQSNAYVGGSVDVTCNFDPFSTGTEEYMYYYNGTGWRQLYSGNAPSANDHNVTISTILDNVTGMHWFRCIADFDGENDECADLGSFYDNDDVSLPVIRDTQPDFDIYISAPQNVTQTNAVVSFDLRATAVTTIEYNLNGTGWTVGCTNCTQHTEDKLLRDGFYPLQMRAVNPYDNTTVYTSLNFTVKQSEGTSVNLNGYTCSQAFGLDCSLWPAASEGDNTFDTCPTSVGGAADEHVNEVSVNSTVVNTLAWVNVTCNFDPFSTGTEEYIYYYNGSGWRELYNAIAPGADPHNVTVNVQIDNTSGTTMHWFRCIVDWDGENDECADSGSYYDNDDVNITVIEPVILPLLLSINQPLNNTLYNTTNVPLDIFASKNADMSYRVNGGAYQPLCNNCTSYFNYLNLTEQSYLLEVLAIDLETGNNVTSSVNFSVQIPQTVVYTTFNGTTTDFLSEPDLENVCSAILEKTAFGMIRFNTCINVSGVDLDAGIILQNNDIGVNTTQLPQLNLSANITFYDVTLNEPTLINTQTRQGCSACQRIATIGNNITYTVPHFSSYTLIENRTLHLFDDTDTGLYYPGDVIRFYANYTNETIIANANCTLVHDATGSWSSPFQMQYNLSSTWYTYSSSFASAGTFNWNVTCAHPQHTTIMGQDNATISIVPPPTVNVSIFSQLLTNTTDEYLQCAYDPSFRTREVSVAWYEGGSSMLMLQMPYEPTNTLDDRSGNGHNATASGATWGNTSGYNGAGAYVFDGTNDYISHGDVDSFDILSEVTISIWFNRTIDNSGTALDTNHNVNNVLLAQSASGSNDNLEIGTEGTNVELYVDTSGTDNFVVDAGIQNNQWYHLVMVYDETATNELSLYIDGVLIQQWSTPSGPIRSSATSPLTLGIARPDRADPWGDFGGIIDQVEVFDRAFDINMIQSLYLNQSLIIPSSLTSLGQQWQCAITPYDIFQNGTQTFSPTLTVIDDITINATLVSELGTNTTVEDLLCHAPLPIGFSASAVTWLVGGSSINHIHLPIAGNTSNALLDISSNGNNAQINGEMYLNTSLGYDNNGAFVLDGDNDYLNFGDVNVMDAPSEFSVSLWFNRTVDNSGTALDTNHNVNNVLVAQSSDGANDNLEIGTEGGNVELYVDTAGTDSFTASAGITNNVWHHIGITYDSNDASELRLYVDGALVQAWGTPSGSLSSSSTSPLTLGIARPDRADPWGDFEGLLDEVQFFDRALSAEAMQQLYTNSSRLAAEETTQNDVWECRVDVFAGNDYSFGISNNVTILADTEFNVTLQSELLTNLTTEDLICSYNTTGPIDHAFAWWQRNGNDIITLYTPFDINETAIQDITGNLGYDFSSFATWLPNGGYDGKGAFSFDGSTEYIFLDDGSATSPIFDATVTQRTIFARVFPTDVSGTTYRVIFEEGGTVNGLNMYIYDSRIYAGAWSEGTGWNGQWPAFDITPNQWHTVGLIFDGANTRVGLFYDGQINWSVDAGATQVAAHTGDDALGRAEGGTVGSPNNPAGSSDISGTTHYYSGIIDDFRVYNDAMSVEHLTLLHQNQTARLASAETQPNENWTCTYVFYQGNETKVRVSNQLTIREVRMVFLELIHDIQSLGNHVYQGMIQLFNLDSRPTPQGSPVTLYTFFDQGVTVNNQDVSVSPWFTPSTSSATLNDPIYNGSLYQIELTPSTADDSSLAGSNGIDFNDTNSVNVTFNYTLDPTTSYQGSMIVGMDPEWGGVVWR